MSAKENDLLRIQEMYDIATQRSLPSSLANSIAELHSEDTHS